MMLRRNNKMKTYRFNTENNDAIGYRKTLKEFLKSKRVLTLFKQRLKEEGYEHNDIMMMGVVEPMHPRKMIDSFDWSRTIEGFGFWSKINVEWLEYISIFKGNYTSQQYWNAKEEYLAFKQVMEDLDIKFNYLFCRENDFLDCNTKEYITRTLLAGHSYYEVLEIWLEISNDFKESEKGTRLKALSDVMFKMNSDPKFKASALVAYTKAMELV